MYEWRKMTEAERKATLAARRAEKRPWHSPPRLDSGPGYYLITGACYEHKPIIESTPDRLREFSEELLALMEQSGAETTAWCVLPNHYHVLIFTKAIRTVLNALKLFHGRKARAWNLEDGAKGRKVFGNYRERFMQTEAQFRTALNYVVHNPVKHGHVDKWDDWKYSSARAFLEEQGREEVRRGWLAYPIGDFGKGWDD